MHFTKSLALWERALRVIPAGCQLLSKSPQAHVLGAYPIFIERGEGSHVWDVDGNEFIDLTMGFGPHLVGYRHPDVVDAVRNRMEKWTSFTLLNPDTITLAELLCKIVPCAEMVRFGKHGSDATGMAVRCARAVTGREKIAMYHYHGWHDWSVVKTELSSGIPKVLDQYALRFEYNDIESLAKLFAEHPNEIAGVIMEPVVFDPPADDFLRRVRNLTHAHGALLIFDEVITGFRFSPGGAQQYFGVTPDLAAFGKAIGGGLPLSALVGKAEYMKAFDYNRTFFSSTFGDEALSIAAGIATVDLIRNHGVDHVWDMGQALQKVYDGLAKDHGLTTRLIGYPCFMTPIFPGTDGTEDLVLRSLFMQEMAARGVLFGRYQFLSMAHTPADLSKIAVALGHSFRVLEQATNLGNARSFLRGEPIEPVRA